MGLYGCCVIECESAYSPSRRGPYMHVRTTRGPSAESSVWLQLFSGAAQSLIFTKKAKMDDAFHQRLRVALQDKGLPDSGSTTECLTRLSASSTVKPKKRKHHPGAGSSAPSIDPEDARAKLSKNIASLPYSLRTGMASHIGLKPRADPSQIAAALLK